MRPVTLIKRYANRRLYDTKDSRYITLADLSRKIQQGEDVKVVDAKTGADLTQATLTQIILESRGAAKMLPPALLMRLIRLGDASLSEFLGRYMTLALDLYLHAKRGAAAVSGFNPFATIPFDAASSFARMFAGAIPFDPRELEPVPEEVRRSKEMDPDVAALRADLERLKEEVRKKRRQG